MKGLADLNQNGLNKILTLADDGLISHIYNTKHQRTPRMPKQCNNWIVHPSDFKTMGLSSIQTRYKRYGHRCTLDNSAVANWCQQSHLMEPWLNKQAIWHTLGSTLTECWPTDKTWKQQHWSARKVCQSWRLWLQRVLNSTSSSYCIKVWCSVSSTKD